jgi:hypothetical protein
MITRFNTAWDRAVAIAIGERDGVLSTAKRIMLVRDLLGRVHLALECAPPAQQLDVLRTRFAEDCGPFWSGSILDGRLMFAPEAVFDSPDAFEIADRIWAIEKMTMGAEWSRGALANKGLQPPRATLYGLKGGVGRSTALCGWAWHLARLGKRVLAIDLDLESPGISSLLLPPDRVPEFGLVDWFVEDAVGNADEDLLRFMVGRSPLEDDTAGQIYVAPSGGILGSDYIAKLSRVYMDVPDEAGTRTFAERVADMVDQLEQSIKPDVVLLDSRAGLHDMAAIATTRLNAMTFLFAAGTRQTWDGYNILLRRWSKHPNIAREVRQRIRIVAAQIPERDRGPYLERFTQDSYDAFSEAFYEETASDPDDFNFDIDAIEAPHYPLRVNWLGVLQGWDPNRTEVSFDEVRAALGDFLDRATELTLNECVESSGENDLA